MENKVTIKFHKALQDFTYGKKSHEIKMSGTYLDVIRACTSIFPELMNLIKKIARGSRDNEELSIIVNGKKLDKDKLNFPVKEDDIIYICPVLLGGGKAGIIIVAIILIIIAILIFIFAPYLGWLAWQLIGAAVGLIIGVATAPKPPALDAGEIADGITQARAGTFKGDGLLNTVTPKSAVGLTYGYVRMGGHIISGRILTIQHGKNDVVSMADNI